MEKQLSRITVAEYLPALRRIFAVIEIGDATHPDPDRVNDLHLHFLKDEFEGTVYVHAMDIIEVWLKGSKFGSDFARIWKVDPTATWDELKDILRKKMKEYAYDVTLIRLVLSKEGRMTYHESHDNSHCDFADDGMNLALIRMLAERQGTYVPTQEIIDRIECKDLKALSEQKRTINAVLHRDMGMSREYEVIDSKPGSGYRVHPLYHVAVL